MSRRRSRLFVLAVAGGLLVATGLLLAAVDASYPLPYVYRVLVYRDADFSDIHHFPSRKIAPSESPSELILAPDPRVGEIVEEHPQIATLERFLEETETTAFLVVRHDRLVLERYAQGHDRDSPQNTFSVSKSIVSALVGVAARDGLVDPDAPITRALPELEDRDPRFAEITVADLLDMRSGIRHSHEVPFPFVDADNALIYYHPDLESVLLERTAIASPPGTFRYNNYNPGLLGLILRRAAGVPVGEYLERELWRPMGTAGAAGWTVDDRGFERMESGFFAPARDLARFGLLYLRRGIAGSRRLLPQAWVEGTTELAEPLELDAYDGRTWSYRAGWWIVPRPSGPADYTAIGRYGQFLYVSPQNDTVFVRNGPGRGQWGDRDWTELFFSVAGRLGAEPPLAGREREEAERSE